MLVMGLVLLTIVTLLGLAAVNSAHVETLLAQNESFRENAASAASAGIEVAIRAIVTSSEPVTVPTRLSGTLPESTARYEVELQFLGFEDALPQAAAEHLAGAHFEILSTGYAARNAADRQRAGVMWVTAAPAAATRVDCEPLVPRHCHQVGELERLSWQHVSPP